MSFQSKKMEESTIKELTDVAQAGAIAEESIMGVRTVQAFNGQIEMVNRYKHELIKGKKYSIETAYWSGLLEGFFFFILYAFLGIGILYGGYLLKVGTVLNPGDVFICIMTQLLGAYFVGLISPHLMVLLNARVAAAVIYETIDTVPKIDVYSNRGKQLRNPKGLVEFKNVHFRYPSRKDVKVLNGLNLKIYPGQTVALVGHSGCGKSTSIGLLTRLYEAEQGFIAIDGMDVRKINIQNLRHIVGIVQQEPTLFNDTVAENIRISNPEITEQHMIEVCKMANAHEFIQNLPNSYDTLIGDGGVQLSGGQKQRIAIARTLARDPKVLILDEATSALDAQSESIVQNALDKAAQGRSTIVIAHRLSTIQNADKIVVFDKGVILEEGTHHELVQQGGHYANLVKAQQFLPEEEENEDIQARHRSESIESNTFGRKAFVRGASATNSLLESRRRLTANFTTAFGNTTDDYNLHTNTVADKNHINDSYNVGTIYKNAQDQYKWMIAGFICALVRGMELPACGLAFTYVFEAFALLNTNSGLMMNRCVRALGIFIGIGVGSWLFQCMGSICYACSSESLTVKLRIAAFKNILFQDAGFFDNLANTPGKLITRLATDAPNIKSVIDCRMFQVTHCVTAIIVSIIIAFIYSWQLALLGLLMLAMLSFGEIFLAYKVMIKNMQIAHNDEAGRTAIEIIENVKTIQLLTLENHFNNQYMEALKKQQTLIRAKCLLESANNCFSMSFEPFMYAACYALGIHIINDGQKSSADVFQAVTGMLLTAFAVTMSSSYFPEFVKANSSAKLLFSMINHKPLTGDPSVGDTPKIQGTISFDKVQFTYPQKQNQPVMTNLCFKALPGQTVALVGPSGTGKSTIISMLERFYDVSGGSLKIDGKDIRNFSLEHLRTQMALVGQEPKLFSGSIKDNICFGLANKVSDIEIQQALTLANAQRFISNLPSGIETEVGEKGGQMSGGQKQRIAIARALIRNPKILLLDEATSALNSESERAVQEALDKAREGRTCITIAHRLSSIQNSDVILYIDNGMVQEAGSHSELIAKKGKYYQLIKKQDLNG
uniref:Uncharacterized protein n=1 Tax=Panagrolaimus superbus TaxID=310955 RepID=A0A914YQM5_9BILA